MNSSKLNLYAINDDFSFDVLYEQCNNHLLEADKKRDQILVLLASITGLYIGNLDKLKKMPGFDVLAVSWLSLESFLPL